MIATEVFDHNVRRTLLLSTVNLLRALRVVAGADDSVFAKVSAKAKGEDVETGNVAKRVLLSDLCSARGRHGWGSGVRTGWKSFDNGSLGTALPTSSGATFSFACHVWLADTQESSELRANVFKPVDWNVFASFFALSTRAGRNILTSKRPIFRDVVTTTVFAAMSACDNPFAPDAAPSACSPFLLRPVASVLHDFC
jgi:hypothetical protein